MVLGTKGDLSKSLKEMKASSKVETTVSTDYYGFIYKMKAFSTIVGIIPGEESMCSVQLLHLVRQIETYSSNYKLAIAQDKLFPSKFKCVVDSHFHLFLQDCRKSLD